MDFHDALDPRTRYWDIILVEPLMNGLKFLAHHLPFGAAGLAIILFTIFIRLVLLPLTIQQIRSQKAMQQIQPEIKALQKKHGDDRAKIQEETMALYKQYGVNPMASCLPMVLQMPVLFALYSALRNLGHDPVYADPLFQEPWLWLRSLDAPDVITHIGTVAITLGGLPGLPGILPILAGVTQWVQQRMMTPPTDDPQQKMQNSMMQFMPLMMLYFGLQFQSGLALYWVTQNVFGIVQQYFSTGWGSLFPNRDASFSLSRGASGTARMAAISGAGRADGAAVPGKNGTRSTARSDQQDGGRRRSGGQGANSGGSGGSGAGGTGGAKRAGKRAGGKR